jgi:D-threonate/D-erythronate kinase
MPDVTIIADDLTGAADCGIAFRVAGLPTFVAFGDAPTPATQIVSVDIDSRRLAPGIAAEKARAAARRAYRQGSRALYKKIDSTLRGNVGPELAATVQVATEAAPDRRPLVVAAPAFPAMGRTTLDGRVLVGGVPLEETELWRGSGMTGPAEMASMLRLVGLHASVVRRDAVRAGEEALAATFARLSEEGADAVLCDADEEDDLARIAHAGARTGLPIVWVGSAGLARHLPAALGLRPSEGAAGPALEERDAPALFLVGSRSRLAREQAERLAAEPGVEQLVLAPEVLLQGERGADWAAAVVALRRALAAGRDVVLLIGLETVIDLGHGVDLAAALGRLAAAHAGGLRGLVATGGDVARAALGALGAGGLHLVGEVEPGVPIGIADAKPPLPVITKAGAFGTPETLQRCRTALGRKSSGRS